MRPRPHLWVLDSDGQPQPAEDTTEWARWFEANRERRVVEQTDVGGVMVSTVFLGIDHNWAGGGAAILFETMIFGGPLDSYQWRYATRAEALEGHRAAVVLVEGAK